MDDDLSEPPDEFNWFTPWRWSFSDWFAWGGMLMIAMITLCCLLLSLI